MFKTRLRRVFGIATIGELSREEKSLTAHVGNAVDFCQTFRQARARTCRPLWDVLAAHNRQHGKRGARRERLAPEGCGVIARRKRARNLRARPARTDRHAIAERLGHCDNVGLHARVLEGEPFPGAPKASLYFVDDQQRFALVAELAYRAEIFG